MAETREDAPRKTFLLQGPTERTHLVALRTLLAQTTPHCVLRWKPSGRRGHSGRRSPLVFRMRRGPPSKPRCTECVRRFHAPARLRSSSFSQVTIAAALSPCRRSSRMAAISAKCSFSSPASAR